jgi:hypothetical protein
MIIFSSPSPFLFPFCTILMVTRFRRSLYHSSNIYCRGKLETQQNPTVKEVEHMSKQNGVKNERGDKENPSQTRASTTIGKEETRSKQRGE